MALWTVYNFLKHLNINLYLLQTFELWSNPTDKVSNCNISNVIHGIWCHYLSLNDIRWHKMSLDDIWCLVIELSPTCCQNIPWGGHQRQIELSVCLWVSLWVCESVCLWVNLWFIELLDAAKNSNQYFINVKQSNWYFVIRKSLFLAASSSSKTYKFTYRQTDSQTHRLTDSQTDT